MADNAILIIYAWAGSVILAYWAGWKRLRFTCGVEPRRDL